METDRPIFTNTKYGTTLSLSILSFLLFSSVLLSASPRPTTVAGFKNLGKQVDDNIGLVLTRSLISQLLRIPGSVVTSYDDLVKYDLQKKLWNGLDREQALNASLYFDTKRVLFGEYLYSRQSNYLEVTFYAYDTASGEMLIKRQLTGKGGIALFSTIDTIAGNITGLLVGQDQTYGTLKLQIRDTTNQYRVDINARTTGYFISNSIQDFFCPVGDPFDLAIYRLPDKLEVWRCQMALTDNAPVTLTYQPHGRVLVKNESDPADLYLNHEFVKVIGKLDDARMLQVLADVPQVLEIKVRGLTVEQRTITVKEGDSELAVFNVKSAVLPSDQSGGAPWISLALPGYAQYQAGQWPWGLGFSAFGLAGFGSAIFFGTLSFMLDQKALTYTDDANRDRVNGLSSGMLWYALGSAAVWLAASGFSCWMGFAEQKPASGGTGLGLHIGPGGLCLQSSVSF